MKLFVVFLTFAGFVLTGCQSNPPSAPLITESLIRAGLHEKADGPTLAQGRKVFVNRCILCHALPDVARYKSARVPGIVGWMSGRAHLTTEQRDALVKYLLAVKSQSQRHQDFPD
jgi:mono/diheme cytochrome c family protein